MTLPDEPGAVPSRDDEGVGYVVLLFGLLGVAAGALVGVGILAVATPPRFDLGLLVEHLIYQVICLAPHTTYCVTHPPYAGLGADFAWFAGLVFVAWTGGGLVTFAWHRVASAATRPVTFRARERVEYGTTAVAILVPAAIMVYLIVIAPSLVGPAALVALAGWLASYALDSRKSREVRAAERDLRVRPGRRRAATRSPRGRSRHPGADHNEGGDA